MAANLTGRTVLVTGASSGIGRAVAVRAAELGARLVLTGRRAEALEETRRLCLRPADHRLLAGNLTDAPFVRALVAAAVADAPLAGFVHSAGVCPVAPLAALSAVAARNAFDIGCGAFLEIVGELVRTRRLAEGFAVAVLSSVSAREGWAGGALYCASKGAVSSSVRALETEFAPRGWKVRAFEPGPVDTPMRAKLRSLGAPETALQSPEVLAREICAFL